MSKSTAGAEPKIELVPVWRVARNEAVADYRVFIDGAYRAFWRVNSYRRNEWQLQRPFGSVGAFGGAYILSTTTSTIRRARDAITCDLTNMEARTREALPLLPTVAQLSAFKSLDEAEIEARAYKRKRALQDQFDEPETGAALFATLAALVDACDRDGVDVPELAPARAAVVAIREKEAAEIARVTAREQADDAEIARLRTLTLADAHADADASRRAVEAKLNETVKD